MPGQGFYENSTGMILPTGNNKKQKAEGTSSRQKANARSRLQESAKLACLMLSAYCFVPSAFCFLLLPRQYRSLTPANDLQRRKAILVNHAEALIGLAQYFLAWMLLEAKQYFEEGGSH